MFFFFCISKFSFIPLSIPVLILRLSLRLFSFSLLFFPCFTTFSVPISPFSCSFFLLLPFSHSVPIFPLFCCSSFLLLLFSQFLYLLSFCSSFLLFLLSQFLLLLPSFHVTLSFTFLPFPSRTSISSLLSFFLGQRREERPAISTVQWTAYHYQNGTLLKTTQYYENDTIQYNDNKQKTRRYSSKTLEVSCTLHYYNNNIIQWKQIQYKKKTLQEALIRLVLPYNTTIIQWD